jgi:hypothetical protein
MRDLYKLELRGKPSRKPETSATEKLKKQLNKPVNPAIKSE